MLCRNFILMRDLRKKLFSALEANALPEILIMAKENHQVLSQLVRLAYDKETLVGWRAIKAIGSIARELVQAEYPLLRELVRKLLWSLSDESGGIGWSAPEIIGEIVNADTVRFRDVVPLIAEVYSIEEKVFRPGVVYALYRISQADPAVVSPHVDLAMKALGDQDPLVRVYALKLLRELQNVLTNEKKNAFLAVRNKMSHDMAEVWIFEQDAFKNVMVADLAKKLQ
jgi:hypothetical protein